MAYFLDTCQVCGWTRVTSIKYCPFDDIDEETHKLRCAYYLSGRLWEREYASTANDGGQCKT